MMMAVYLVIRQTGLHALFMLATTCRNHHGSRKFGVADGKFILSGTDKIQLFAPPIAKLILYIFWFWFWIWWWWPALILGFVWVVALYDPAGPHRRRRNGDLELALPGAAVAGVRVRGVTHSSLGGRGHPRRTAATPWA